MVMKDEDEEEAEGKFLRRRKFSHSCTPDAITMLSPPSTSLLCTIDSLEQIGAPASTKYRVSNNG